MGCCALKKHLFIPDTQVTPGCPTKHLEWVGRYITEQEPDVVVHAGDHWDMESLSSYDTKSGKSFEGRRYKADIQAGNDAMDVLMAPIDEHWRRKKKKRPEFHFLMGNHEERIARAIERNPHELEGIIGFQDLNLRGWKVHDFLVPVEIDGVHYCHYFVAPMTGRALSAVASTRLSQVGCSFTAGHQQGLQLAIKYLGIGVPIRALIAGSCYLHNPDYIGPQGNQMYWRGIIVKFEVENGNYCLLEVSLDYLCRRYEKRALVDFL